MSGSQENSRSDAPNAKAASGAEQLKLVEEMAEGVMASFRTAGAEADRVFLCRQFGHLMTLKRKLMRESFLGTIQKPAASIDAECVPR